MFKKFKELAMKGSLVDVAAAFVMGLSFKYVVISFTSRIISQVIGLIFKEDFRDLKCILEKGIFNKLRGCRLRIRHHVG